MANYKTVAYVGELKKLFPNTKTTKFGWSRSYYGNPQITFRSDFSAVKIRRTIPATEIARLANADSAAQGVEVFSWEPLPSDTAEQVQTVLKQAEAERKAKAAAKRKKLEQLKREREAERARWQANQAVGTVEQALKVLKKAGWDVTFKGTTK